MSFLFQYITLNIRSFFPLAGKTVGSDILIDLGEMVIFKSLAFRVWIGTQALFACSDLSEDSLAICGGNKPSVQRVCVSGNP